VFEATAIRSFTETEMDRAKDTFTEMQPVKIMHSFYIGDTRTLYVDEENDVSITDDSTGKRAFFTGPRWVRFVQEIPTIDKAVQRAMTYKPTVFQQHIGGQWHVSVTDEVPTVDIRRWFMRGLDSVLRPTPAGISLTYIQWGNLKKVAEKMKNECSQFNDMTPCWHDSQRQLEACRECNPTPR